MQEDPTAEPSDAVTARFDELARFSPKLEGATIVDKADIERVGDLDYKSTSEDPYITFTMNFVGPDDRHLIFRIAATPFNETARGALYFDLGGGFNEVEKISFAYDRDGVTWVRASDLAGAVSCRWDPDEQGESLIRIKSLAVYPIPDKGEYWAKQRQGDGMRVEPLSFALMIEEGLGLTASGRETQGYQAPFSEFDIKHYRDCYPDVVEAGVDPLQHFVDFGWKEGRSPSPYFDVKQWLAASDRFREAILLSRGSLPPKLEDDDWDRQATKKPEIGSEQQKVLCRSQKRGVLFIGYFEASLGLGEAARGTVNALSGSRLHHAIYPFNKHVESRFYKRFRPDLYDQYYPYAINVFEMAADQLPFALEEIGAWRTRSSYNVYRAYWELPAAPEAWRPIVEPFDEIWAPNDFVAKAFEGIFCKTIRIIPPHVDVARQSRYGRDYFKLNEEVFYFMFSFDFFSSAARKNPLAILKAFKRAFPNSDKVGLVMKYIGRRDLDESTYITLAQSAAYDKRIVLLCHNYTRDELISLIDVVDCYISLHRSEGFGLGMAEAMLLGKPVIATDFGGNKAFLSEQSGYPVDYELRPLADGEYVFSRDQYWAEPSIESASEQMVRVFCDHNERERRSATGRALVKERYGKDNVSSKIVEATDEIERRLGLDP